MLLILKAIGDQHLLILQLKAWQAAHLTVLRDALAQDDSEAQAMARRATQILHADFQKYVAHLQSYQESHDVMKFVNALLQNDPQRPKDVGGN